MLTLQELETVIGAEACDAHGEKLGKIDNVYIDDQTSQPAFLSVHTGFLGTHHSLVPASGATRQDGKVQVPFDKDQVKHAPEVDTIGGHIDADEERRILAYYGIPYGSMSQRGETTGETTTTGPATGHASDDAMTRSEQQVRVGRESQEAGRARLRKFVETEHVTETVPVTRERAVVEHEPISEGNRDRALDGPEISESEHEMTLHEERPVVEKRTEPVERVRLAKESETAEQPVSTEVAKERIEVEGAEDTTRRR